MVLKLEIGSTFDKKYEILEHIGAGGTGSVYKARQFGIDRILALKLLSPDLACNEVSFKRFEREASLLALLNNPHLAAFYSYAIADIGIPYIAMEYISAGSLRERLLANGRINWHEAVTIAIQVSQAMTAAHSKAVIHRDLKPENILLAKEGASDFVKIIDFGLARITDGMTTKQLEKLTKTGQVIGSIYYIAPEIVRGQKAGPRSDLYSLGCILYECITGNPPFEADSPIELLRKHAQEELL